LSPLIEWKPFHILSFLLIVLGGKLSKGPYLPQTLEGLGKTTKAVLGKK